MSFETIRIFQRWPIINGYCQIPPNAETDKTKTSALDALVGVDGTELRSLPSGSGTNTGAGFGQQTFIELPGITPNSWYNDDPAAEDVSDSHGEGTSQEDNPSHDNELVDNPGDAPFDDEPPADDE